MISAIFLFLNSRCTKPIKMFLKKLFSFWNAGDMIPMSTVPNTFGVWQHAASLQGAQALTPCCPSHHWMDPIIELISAFQIAQHLNSYLYLIFDLVMLMLPYHNTRSPRHHLNIIWFLEGDFLNIGGCQVMGDGTLLFQWVRHWSSNLVIWLFFFTWGLPPLSLLWPSLWALGRRFWWVQLCYLLRVWAHHSTLFSWLFYSCRLLDIHWHVGWRAMLVVVGLDVVCLYIHVALWPAHCISCSCNVNYWLQLVGHESRTGSICNWLKLVATTHATVCNWLHVVVVAVAQVCRILKTSLGPVAPKKAKKMDRTGLWNTNKKWWGRRDAGAASSVFIMPVSTLSCTSCLRIHVYCCSCAANCLAGSFLFVLW